jgi:hypothetical protein
LTVGPSKTTCCHELGQELELFDEIAVELAARLIAIERLGDCEGA